MEDDAILTETEDRDPQNHNAYLKVRFTYFASCKILPMNLSAEQLS